MNCGSCNYENGELVDEYYPEGEEAFNFANELWGYPEEEFYEEEENSFADKLQNAEERASLNQTEQTKALKEFNR